MEDGKTCPTLRAEAHRHEPIVIEQRKMKRQQLEGIDFYNQSVTGGVSKTLMAAVNPYQIPGLLDTRGKSYGIETSPGRDFSCMVETSTTLRVSTYKNGVLTVRNEPKIYENHSQDARYRDMGDCAPTCHAQMGTGGNNIPLVYTKTAHPKNTDEAQGFRETDTAKTITASVNPGSEIRAEEIVLRQENGDEGRPAKQCVVICVHGSQDPITNEGENANAVGRNQGAENVIMEIRDELPFDCALCGHRGETKEVDIAEQLREEHPTWIPGWLDELGPIRLTLWGCPECAEWHTPRAWNDIQVRRTIETKLLAVLDGDKINKKERRGGSGLGISEEPVAYTSTVKDVHGVATDTHGACTEHLTVRRLLPVETERLMGFPDNWTRIPWRGKPAEKCPDAPRYKACGNSMCVNCMEWIGERIEKEEQALKDEGR